MQLRQTPLPQVLGSLGLEAAGQRGHSAGAEAGEAVGTQLPRQPPLLAPDPRPAGTPGRERESPFSRKNRSSSCLILFLLVNSTVILYLALLTLSHLLISVF